MNVPSTHCFSPVNEVCSQINIFQGYNHVSCNLQLAWCKEIFIVLMRFPSEVCIINETLLPSAALRTCVTLQSLRNAGLVAAAALPMITPGNTWRGNHSECGPGSGFQDLWTKEDGKKRIWKCRTIRNHPSICNNYGTLHICTIGCFSKDTL